MLRRFFTSLFILALAFVLPASVLAQNSYLFSVDKEVVHVLWNSDGTMGLDYTWVFTNQPSAHVIDFVDVGMPNSSFDINTASADVNGSRVSVSQSDYQGSGSGFAVALGGLSIQPGASGTVHVYVGKITNVLYPDSSDSNYASGDFAPTYFDSQYLTGNTDLSMTFHLPPGVKPEEPRWHDAPSGFPAQPQTGIDSQNRVTYTWQSSSARASESYTFGASFPKQYVPDSAIIQTNFLDAIFGMIAGFFSFMAGSLPCLIFIAFFFGIPILNAVQGRRRKLQYLSPKISIEGHGIKRGLTAVEAAILMEQPLDKVLTMILFGVVKKNAATVTTRDPLAITVTEPAPAGLHEYENDFLKAFKDTDARDRKTALRTTTINLVKLVSEKMKGFSRNETIEYYKRIMETAWEQVQKADTPEVQMTFFDQQLEWTMLDKDYDERSRRVFHGPVYVPMWWGNYDPAYRGMTSQPRSLSQTAAPSMPSSGSGRSLPQLPGADFAASMVTGVQTFSQKVIGNITDFTSSVTNVTNPPPKPSSSSYRSGGGGRSCACACACAGCACACAGGGR